VSLKIRTFRDADTDAVVELWKRAGIDRPWLDLRAEIREKRRRDRSLFLVAVEGERLVGAVMGAYDGRRGWVYHLATDPALEGRGVGTSLMDELERRMARLGIKKVNLQVRADNTAVIGFYERRGYRDDRLTSLSKWLHPPKSVEPQRDQDQV